jgi:predicted Zn-dependent protease
VLQAQPMQDISKFATRGAVVEFQTSRNIDKAELETLTGKMDQQDTTQSARWTRAFTHVRQGDWEKALPELDLLLKADPDNSDYLNLKAHSLLNIGEYEKAIACFETWVSKHPTAETWMFYGYALVTVGRPQDSIAAYREAISRKADLGEAYWSLSNLKTFRFTPFEIIAMHEALERTELDPRRRWLMHFALGKALEDTKQYAESFEQYQKRECLISQWAAL